MPVKRDAISSDFVRDPSALKKEYIDIVIMKRKSTLMKNCDAVRPKPAIKYTTMSNMRT